MLLDASGATTARTVSDAAGRYRLSSMAVAKTIRAIRIGYTPATLPLAANSDSVVVDLQLERLPPVLTAVHVIDQPECPVDAHGGEAFALWEQTRAALLATVVAQEANPATITMITYARTLTPDGAQVRSQTMRDSTFLSTHGVVSRRGATEYATLGYREVDREHDVEHYYAPDAEVLLDSAFARSHCISFRGESAANPGDVGLAFTPLPHPKTQGDSLIDVSGTIWLRQQSPVLHSIDFQFTNTSDVRSSSDTLAGGSMVYREMPNSTAFVTRWSVHVPERVSRTITVRGRAVPTSPTVSAIREAGGEVAGAHWPDGTAWTSTDLAHITGQVTSGDSHPLRGVLVGLRGTAFQGRTDSVGGFVLPPLLAGTYALDAFDPQFAEFGLTPSTSVAVTVARGVTKQVALTLPSRQALVDSLCAESGRDTHAPSGTGLILGEVRAPGGRSGANALLRASWVVSTNGSAAETVHLQGRADSTGHFQICGTPVRVPVQLSATSGDLASSDVETIASDAGSIASATLSLLASSDPALPAYRRRSIQVEDSTSSTPLAGVEVIDVSAQRTLGSTGESGRVGLASLPEGTTLLRVRKPGFAQRVIAFDISPRDTTPLVVRLQHVEQLATVTVTASMASRTATASGFDSRLAAHQGHFLTGAELQTRDGEPLSSALANLGMREQSRGSAIILLGGRTNRPCPVTIFVDGFLLYSSIPAGMAPVDARSLNAGDYGAAEYYVDTDTAPPQFKMTGAMCGTLLLWTRN